MLQISCLLSLKFCSNSFLGGTEVKKKGGGGGGGGGKKRKKKEKLEMSFYITK